MTFCHNIVTKNSKIIQMFMFSVIVRPKWAVSSLVLCFESFGVRDEIENKYVVNVSKCWKKAVNRNIEHGHSLKEVKKQSYLKVIFCKITLIMY